MHPTKWHGCPSLVPFLYLPTKPRVYNSLLASLESQNPTHRKPYKDSEHGSHRIDEQPQGYSLRSQRDSAQRRIEKADNYHVGTEATHDTNPVSHTVLVHTDFPRHLLHDHAIESQTNNSHLSKIDVLRGLFYLVAFLLDNLIYEHTCIVMIVIIFTSVSFTYLPLNPSDPSHFPICSSAFWILLCFIGLV